MIFNMVGGGGGKLYAIIAVTYPEGSICTCSNGTKTLKARDTSGKALFNVTVGEWTVSCTDGTDMDSKTVSITAAGQVENVELSYELLLYNKGDECSSVTGGWADFLKYDGSSHLTKNSSYLLITGKSGSYYGSGSTTKKINLAGYSTLKILAKRSGSGACYFGIASANNVTYEEFKASQTVTATVYTEYALSITNSQASYYVMFCVDDTADFYVKKLWLE